MIWFNLNYETFLLEKYLVVSLSLMRKKKRIHRNRTIKAKKSWTKARERMDKGSLTGLTLKSQLGNKTSLPESRSAFDNNQVTNLSPFISNRVLINIGSQMAFFFFFFGVREGINSIAMSLLLLLLVSNWLQ